MNIASEDLSRELYALSGWVGSESYRRWTPDAPYYDLGPLLRKLPASLDFKHYLVLGKNDAGNKYTATYLWAERRSAKYKCQADSPEDALCKLAIELFKQGILQPVTGGPDA